MKLLTLLFFVYTLLDVIHAAPQNAPPAVKNAIESLLNPEKGPSALQKSCEKIRSHCTLFSIGRKNNGKELKYSSMQLLNDVTRRKTSVNNNVNNI